MRWVFGLWIGIGDVRKRRRRRRWWRWWRGGGGSFVWADEKREKIFWGFYDWFYCYFCFFSLFPLIPFFTFLFWCTSIISFKYSLYFCCLFTLFYILCSFFLFQYYYLRFTLHSPLILGSCSPFSYLLCNLFVSLRIMTCLSVGKGITYCVSCLCVFFIFACV